MLSAVADRICAWMEIKIYNINGKNVLIYINNIFMSIVLKINFDFFSDFGY